MRCGSFVVFLLLQVKRIVKSSPCVKAPDDVFFDLKKGEIHAIVGKNSAGKSTFIKVLTGVHQPDGGEIILNGRRIGTTGPTFPKSTASLRSTNMPCFTDFGQQNRNYRLLSTRHRCLTGPARSCTLMHLSPVYQSIPNINSSRPNKRRRPPFRREFVYHVRCSTFSRHPCAYFGNRLLWKRTRYPFRQKCTGFFLTFLSLHV